MELEVGTFQYLLGMNARGGGGAFIALKIREKISHTYLT